MLELFPRPWGSRGLGWRGVETFDQALKYLAQKNPADFIGYALGEAREWVLEP